VDFDLRGASIGNLILTAGYLAADKNFSVVLDTFRILARVLGEVALSCEAASGRRTGRRGRGLRPA